MRNISSWEPNGRQCISSHLTIKLDTDFVYLTIELGISLHPTYRSQGEFPNSLPTSDKACGEK